MGKFRSHVSGFAIDCSILSFNRAVGLTADQCRYIISSCCFVVCSLPEFDLKLVPNVFVCLFVFNVLSEHRAADCH